MSSTDTVQSNLAVVQTRRDQACLFEGRAAARCTPPR